MNKEESDRYSIGDRYMDHAGYVPPSDRWARHDVELEKTMAYDDLPSVSTRKTEGFTSDKENPHLPIKFDVTIEVTAAELAELEKHYHPKKVVVTGSIPDTTHFLPGHGPGIRGATNG